MMCEKMGLMIMLGHFNKRNKLKSVFLVLVIFAFASFFAGANAGSYPFFGPTEVLYKGQFFDDGGAWRLSAKKSFSDDVAKLVEFKVDYQGQRLAIPKEIFLADDVRIEKIPFRYVPATALAVLQEEHGDPVEAFWLELEIPYGGAYWCDDNLAGRGWTNFYVLEYNLDGILKSNSNYTKENICPNK